MILIIYAHPYPSRSRANRALLEAVRTLPDVEVRSLYGIYPDFDIDAGAEQEALKSARLVVFLHPFYWYSVPGLLKHWFDKVLVRGWAYGQGGTALHGKHLLWATTTGGDEYAYTAAGRHEQPFDNFIAPVHEMVRYCGMQWEAPFIVHGAHLIDDAALGEHAQRFKQLIAEWAAAHPLLRPEHAGTEEVTP